VEGLASCIFIDGDPNLVEVLSQAFCELESVLLTLERSHLNGELPTTKILHLNEGRESVPAFHIAHFPRQGFDFHVHNSRADDVQISGRPVREIDDSPFHERPAVVDRHNKGLLVREVGDFHHSVQGQQLVGCRFSVHVVDLPLDVGRP